MIIGHAFQPWHLHNFGLREMIAQSVEGEQEVDDMIRIPDARDTAVLRLRCYAIQDLSELAVYLASAVI